MFQATTSFYRLKASEQLQANGVQSFMQYAGKLILLHSGR